MKFPQKLKKLFRLLIDPYYRQAIWRGAAAGVEHEKVLRLLSPETVVDIGANRGQFALVCRRTSASAKIISFEPLGEPASIFRRVFESDENVTLYQAAIGPEKGLSIINVSKRDDSSSILPISGKQDSIFPGTGESHKNNIDIAPLSEFVAPNDIQSPSLLKMDVQGFELDALKGCGDLLRRFDYAYIECSFLELYTGQALADDIVKFMHAADFAFTGIYHLSEDHQHGPIQADFLFSRGS